MGTEKAATLLAAATTLAGYLISAKPQRGTSPREQGARVNCPGPAIGNPFTDQSRLHRRRGRQVWNTPGSTKHNCAKSTKNLVSASTAPSPHYPAKLVANLAPTNIGKRAAVPKLGDATRDRPRPGPTRTTLENRVTRRPLSTLQELCCTTLR